MEINKLEKNNNLDINNNIELEKEQKNFLNTTLGKTINSAIDIGIRAVLPDFLDEQIVNIKNNLLEYGLKEGISKTIEDAINLGKSTIGIFTGNFENISQMQDAVKSGGVIDGISTLLDSVINRTRKAGLIDNNVSSLIKRGKNIILNNIENNIENTFKKQYQNLEYMNKCIDNWKNSFKNQDFAKMEREYKKLEKQLQQIAPIEKTINEAKTIEVLHNLIKNNGQDFNLTNEQLELAERLK